MKKAFLLILILVVSVISTACINNLAVQELNNKAKEYMDKGDYENAISRLKSSVDLDDSIFESHYNLGSAYTQAEKYPEAIQEFEKAIKINPDLDVTYYSLAVAYENQAKDLTNPPKSDEEVGMDESENLIQKKDELTSEQKSAIVDSFNKSIENYKKYLEKTSQNSSEVREKIEYLENEVLKYSEE